MIDTDRADANIQIGNSQLVYQFILQRLASFGAEPADAFIGVVAGERGQVHAGDRADEPGKLPIFFDGAASDQGGGTAFDGAGVDADRFDPFEVERGAAIDVERAASKYRDGRGVGLSQLGGRSVGAEAGWRGVRGHNGSPNETGSWKREKRIALEGRA